MSPLLLLKSCVAIIKAYHILSALDPFRNLDHDLKEARDHVLNFDENFDDYTFKTTKYTNFPVSKLYQYDDIKPWLDIEPNELKGIPAIEQEEILRKFRGQAWADKAKLWLQDGIPAVVIIETPEFVGIADGRGRTNLAIGLGLKTVPVVILKSNILPHQTKITSR